MLGFHKMHFKETMYQTIKKSRKKLHNKPHFMGVNEVLLTSLKWEAWLEGDLEHFVGTLLKSVKHHQLPEKLQHHGKGQLNSRQDQGVSKNAEALTLQKRFNTKSLITPTMVSPQCLPNGLFLGGRRQSAADCASINRPHQLALPKSCLLRDSPY